MVVFTIDALQGEVKSHTWTNKRIQLKRNYANVPDQAWWRRLHDIIAISFGPSEKDEPCNKEVQAIKKSHLNMSSEKSNVPCRYLKLFISIYKVRYTCLFALGIGESIMFSTIVP